MAPPVWVITGFRTQIYDKHSKNTLVPDSIIGRFTEESGKKLMHGFTWNTNTDGNIGYCYLRAALQPLEEYKEMSDSERDMGAVTGGFVYKTDGSSKAPYVKQQEWGLVDMSTAVQLAMFFGPGERDAYYVMACFGKTDEAPVSGFWRNGSAMVGPNVHCTKHDWGHNISSWPDTGDYAISLSKVIETTVLKIDFPSIDETMKCVKPDVITSRTFVNDHDTITLESSFTYTKEVSDTASLSFTTGMGVKASAEFEAKVPFIGSAKTTLEVEAKFEVGKTSTTTNSQTFERNQKLLIPPMSTVKAQGVYSQGIITVDVVLLVQEKFENGSVQTYKVPSTYKGVSAFNDKVNISDPTRATKRSRDDLDHLDG